MRILFAYACIAAACLSANTAVHADATATQLQRLQAAYPDFIKAVSDDSLTWADGTRMQVIDSNEQSSPSFLEQLQQPHYPSNATIQCPTYTPANDPGRVRHELFFAKMYGGNENEVRNNLDTIYWMPAYFQHQYPLVISRINGISTHLQHVSDQLETLVRAHPEFIQYLDHPSGTFYWRHIQNSNRRSPHSFGIAIDINVQRSNYWIWDTGIKSNNLNQTDVITYKNQIPCEIVSVFENNGFIWGGKWQHHDTMHFEYRPEML